MTPATSMRRESPQPSSGAAPPPNEPITTSDNESGGEKPVREKLRETRIANQAMEEDTTASPGSSAGRLRRKRSLEDIEDGEDNAEEPGKPGKHARKRSRSNTPDDQMDSVENGTSQVGTNGFRDCRSLTPALSSGRAEEVHPASLASPKNKRTRDQVLKDEESVTTASGDGSLATRSVDKDNKSPGDDRQTKRHRDSGSPEPASKIPPSSGFVKSSATSPFGALASSAKADVPQTSESKFASSGFGKLASASASPFIAPKGPSVFGASTTKSAYASSGTSSAFGASKDPAAPMQASAFGASAGSAFGSGSGSSLFGTASKPSVLSSIANTGSVFGGPFTAGKLGSSLGSFAGGSGPKIEGLSTKPSKPFGAAEESDEEPAEDEEDEDDEDHKTLTHVTDEAAAKRDKRFYEQDVETGEEEEKTLFTSRAKLFSFVKNADGTGAWKERGSGFIKVNVRDVEVDENDGEEEGKTKEKDQLLKTEKKKKARFIMRANGTNRLVLNSPVEKHTPFGQPGGNGTKPTGKGIMFMGVLDSGVMQTLQLSMSPDSAKGLWDVVQQLREEM